MDKDFNSKIVADTKKQEAEKAENETLKVINLIHQTTNVTYSIIPKNIFKERSASFLGLYPEIKRMILKMLDISSGYNLSLVWKDMANEFWRSIDVHRNWTWITKTKDLEYAGVLASGKHFSYLNTLYLSGVDVSGIPINIINNLVKIVWKKIHLVNVKGWKTTMLNDAECSELKIVDVTLGTPEFGSVKRPIRVRNEVEFDNVRGDLQGLFDNLTLEHADVDRIKTNSLLMTNMDISDVPANCMNKLFKTVKKKITLRNTTGFYSPLLNGTTCHRVHFWDMEIRDLEDVQTNGQNMIIKELDLQQVAGDLNSLLNNIKHCEELYLFRYSVESSLLLHINMAEILKEKVKCLSISSPFPDWLSQYDGQGMCENIKVFVYDLEKYEAWAKAREWEIKKGCQYLTLNRPQVEVMTSKVRKEGLHI